MPENFEELRAGMSAIARWASAAERIPPCGWLMGHATVTVSRRTSGSLMWIVFAKSTLRKTA
jgi:hypothetical protein